jgi:hypothetical protein
VKKIIISLIILFPTYCIGQVPGYINSTDLVGWWPFNGNGNDESGNGFNGTINGATPTSDRFMNANSAYFFNSINIIQTSISSGFAPASSTSGYSFSFWFNGSNNTSVSMLIQYKDGLPTTGNVSNYDIFSYHTGCTIGSMAVQNFPFNNPSACSPSLINTNAWNHICVLFNQITDSFKAYRNGQFWFKGQIGNIAPSTGTLSFGNNANSAFSFNGKLDDIGCWKRLLSDCEIQRLYLASNFLFLNQQPDHDTAFQGGQAQFSVGSTTPGLTYQWQENNGSGFISLLNNSTYSGVNTNTLTITNSNIVQNQNHYRCIVSNGICIDTSNHATLTVCNPFITSQPLNQSVAENGNSSFTVAAIGSNNSFQWQGNIGIGFTNLSNAGSFSGVNTNTLNITNSPISLNNSQYRCLVSNGSCIDTSSSALLAVETDVETIGLLGAPKIYPNPGNSQISIEAGYEILRIEIFDNTGRRVLSQNNSGKFAVINIRRLNAGYYLIRINGILNQKFSKQG